MQEEEEEEEDLPARFSFPLRSFVRSFLPSVSSLSCSQSVCPMPTTYYYTYIHIYAHIFMLVSNYTKILLKRACEGMAVTDGEGRSCSK